MRCLALAQSWKNAGGSAIFVMAAEMPEIESRLNSDGFAVHHFTAVSGSERDADLTADLAVSRDAAFVVVDGYQFGSEYQKTLKKTGLHMLFIDDYGHAGSYCADLVMNQNIYARENFYKNRDLRTELLLGPSFVLLRREFLPWRSWTRKNPDQACKMLVTLGGSDPDNLTLIIFNSLQNLASDGIETIIVVGAANAHNAGLEEAVKRSRIPVRLIRNATNMPELMAWADMAIISGGTTSYETAFMGIPSLIVIIAANQVQVAEGFSEIGSAANLGWHYDLSVERIQEKVDSLRSDRESRDSMSHIGRRLVDGRGCTRVIKAILRGIIKVRIATHSDCEQIYKWANDSDTRAASFHSETIKWNTHRSWFFQRLQDPDRVMFICSSEHGRPIGLVRFELAGGEAAISINLNPDARGQGLAGFIIIRTVDELMKRHPICRINAFIKPDNLRSARAFERAGFSDIGPATINGCEARHYAINREDL